MKLEQTLDGEVLVIQPLVNNLDAANVQQFRDAIMPLLRQNPNVLVDLGQVAFIDSAGIGALISCLRVARERDGKFTLCSLTRAVNALFDLMRMHRVFEVHADSNTALRSLA